LLNKGNGVLEVSPADNLQMKGQVRHVRPIKIGIKEAFILARNNDSAKVIMIRRN
jgi:enediyne biosynthesis protein E4